MAFCQNCGAEVEGRYCAKCGTAQTGSAPLGPGNPQPAAAGLDDNVASALCYALGLVTGILFLVLDPYKQNKSIRFHAFQSIFMHLAVLVIFWAVMPALGMLTGGMVWMLGPLLGLASVGLWIFMLVKTYQGQKVVLPLVGQFAEQQA
jgi:uncharacterized membrane protein